MADNLNFHTTDKQQFNVVPPPPLETAEKEVQSRFEQSSSICHFDDLPEVTENAVREALRNEAKRHKYWKASAVTKMTINRIDNSACLHYAMESFTEMRSTNKAVEGVTLGQFLQQQQSTSGSPNAGLNPWDYAMDPPEDFVEQVKVLEMPGTSELMACHSCNAEGLTHCFHCRGYGTDKCTCCRGTGMKAGVAHPAIYTHPMVAAFPHSDLSRGYPSSGTAVVRPPSGALAYGVGTPVHFMTRAGVPPPGIGHHDLCHFCQGRGIRECSRCKGHGKKPCSACGGNGSIRTYIKLRVQFAVEHSDYYSPCEIPEKMLSKVGGQVIMSECQPYILPLKKYPVQQINEISRQMCAAHLQKCIGRCRIIKQRHLLEAIPVAKVYYQLGSREGIFWIYGVEHYCYVPHYPSKCSLI